MVEEVLQWMGGRCCNKREGVATVWRGVAMDGWKVLQQTLGDRCNKRERWGWLEGVATNGRGGTGKMQQDIAIFHSGWTTVNDATAIYGSYCKCCNKVPCTLQKIG